MDKFLNGMTSLVEFKGGKQCLLKGTYIWTNMVFEPRHEKTGFCICAFVFAT